MKQLIIILILCTLVTSGCAADTSAEQTIDEQTIPEINDLSDENEAVYTMETYDGFVIVDSDGTPTGESLESLSIIAGGYKFIIGTKYSEFKSFGFELGPKSNPLPETLEAWEEAYASFIVSDKNEITIALQNLTDTEKNIDDCYVVFLKIDNNSWRDDFTAYGVAKGSSWSQSDIVFGLSAEMLTEVTPTYYGTSARAYVPGNEYPIDMGIFFGFLLDKENEEIIQGAYIQAGML